MDVLKKNVAIARNFKPIEGEELTKLLAKVKPHAGDGRHERFKSHASTSTARTTASSTASTNRRSDEELAAR